jgi:putative acetyltransferase
VTPTSAEIADPAGRLTPAPEPAEMRAVADLKIAEDDPHRDDVRALLAHHLDFARSCSPPEFVFALDLDGLSQPAVTFCSARRDGELVGVGALKELDAHHGELKSMHTSAAARRQGVGDSLLSHLVDLARRRGYRRVSLETGAQHEFGPARALYTGAGFAVCGPFGDYPDSSHSVFMTLRL